MLNSNPKNRYNLLIINYLRNTKRTKQTVAGKCIQAQNKNKILVLFL